MEPTRSTGVSTSTRSDPSLVRFVQQFGKGMGVVNNITLQLAAASIVFMIIGPCIDVISRYVFSQPLIWVDEFSEYALVFCTFFPAAWVLSIDGHVRIDIVLGILDERKRRVLDLISYLIGLGYSLLTLWLTGAYAMEALLTGARFDSQMGIPKFPVLVIIPIGFALLCLQFLMKIASHFYPTLLKKNP